MRKIILLAFLITILANAQDTTTTFATLIIETEPKEAIVIINGKVYGLTPDFWDYRRILNCHLGAIKLNW